MRHIAAWKVGDHMHNQNDSANTCDRKNTAARAGQLAQDAQRHQKDEAEQLAQARAQQDSVDMQEIEGQQPEIPKVGSRDAPGG